jgi:short subunit dehydrogenase-like uncharacterized protein
MTSSDHRPRGTDLVVYGATGTVGGLVARELHGRGLRPVLAGRDGARLAALAAELGNAPMRVAAADDDRALAAAVRGARVVVACAGPFARIGEPVLSAAIDAGAHYIDVASEPGFVRAAYERYESAARRAGVAAVAGMGLEALGDLAAAAAARRLVDEPENNAGDAGPVRAEALPRVATMAPVEQVQIAHVLDAFFATPGVTRSSLETLAAPALIWRRDRWDETAPGASSWRLDASLELGGWRDAMGYPGAEVVTVPRHIAALCVETFASWARARWAMRAAGLAGRLAPWLSAASRTAARTLEPAPAPDAAQRARGRFAIVARCTRGGDETWVRMTGRDVYRSCAAIATWAAIALAGRDRGPTGVLAPAEAFAAVPALRALTQAAELTYQTSYAR